ncbi:hypothetical protein [Pseudovibrio sp. Tun.PSC04-5.I4]|uniref:hypothetical protein n=1 Tax=Pseudovibrio sp. Tun.PSC04-5.I4 TaxID=1798213 RepID=UPI00088C8148|nr:hypothetical protein [Pseudovibrio sp. Tun.PSC04-5.I4]SDR22178.1 hypothetical protein SAMN04515695_3521 [Pseudovibrio sp. Tun.PSC04-5.I4]
MDGLKSYANLKAYDAAQEVHQISEFNLYSDAWFQGEINGDCPYNFLNLMAADEKFGNIRPAVVLRVRWYAELASVLPKFTRETSDKEYHAGGTQDEIAALASLRLGVRLKAGSEIRSFGFDNTDPLGKPEPERSPPPILHCKRNQQVVPRVFQSAQLCNLVTLNQLGKLTREQFTPLIKSARLFQEALWVVESAPEQAWLMLTSALETAAVFHEPKNPKSLHAFEHTQPELTRYLKENADDRVLKEVARVLGGSQKATKKFLDFIAHFQPSPPKKRPHKNSQLDFSGETFNEAMRLIYQYRSLALHDGKPFPAPMCASPFQHQEWDAPAEVGTVGLAVSTLGATWSREDLPICLNLFVYIVEVTLNKWWESMLEE